MQGVASSNPATPTIDQQKPGTHKVPGILFSAPVADKKGAPRGAPFAWWETRYDYLVALAAAEAAGTTIAADGATVGAEAITAAGAA